MPPSPPPYLVDAQQFPGEVLRLLAERRDDLVAAGASWADVVSDQLRTQVRSGSFLGAIWRGPGDEAAAVIGWQGAGTFGRRGWLYLARGHRSAGLLDRLLRELDQDGRPPFVGWSGQIPGLGPDETDAVYQRRGYTPAVRAEMHLPPGTVISPRPLAPAFSTRPLSDRDEDAVASLMERVYHGEPERALFATTVDEAEDARTSVHDIVHGGIGMWLPEASFGIDHDGVLTAYTLANAHFGGLITELGVAPAFRRRGLARALLARTTQSLRSLGFPEPRLMVTMWNDRAVGLYRRVGFEFTPGGAERVWVDLRAFGLARGRAAVES